MSTLPDWTIVSRAQKAISHFYYPYDFHILMCSLLHGVHNWGLSSDLACTSPLCPLDTPLRTWEATNRSFSLSKFQFDAWPVVGLSYSYVPEYPRNLESYKAKAKRKHKLPNSDKGTITAQVGESIDGPVGSEMGEYMRRMIPKRL